MGSFRVEEGVRGRLYVFLGAAPGAGKTFAMLTEGARLAGSGRDVVVAVVESHGRPATEARLEGLERMPLRVIGHRDTWFDELDIDGVLFRHPQVALVDELAHTNVPGCRHEKRWQDVEELLASGIDVVTNLNVSHVDSLNDAVEALTGVAQHETVPDRVVAAAERVSFVDPSPEVLRARLSGAGGRSADDAETALRGFYRADEVSALRDLARSWLAANAGSPMAWGAAGVIEEAAPADRRPGDTPQGSPKAPADRRPGGSEEGSPERPPEGSQQRRPERQPEGSPEQRPPPEAARESVRVVAALTGAPEGRHVVRRAAQIAAAAGGELVGVHVREPSGLLESQPAWLDEQRRLLAELGGRYTEVGAVDVARAVLDVCRSEKAGHLVLAAPSWLSDDGWLGDFQNFFRIGL